MQRRALILLALMLVAMILETLGVGAVLPIIAVIGGDPSTTTASLATFLPISAASESAEQLVSLAMVAMILLFAFKGTVQYFVANRVSTFTAHLQAIFSSRLLLSYLSRPYGFHLERNSTHLLSAINNEARDAANGVHALLLVFADLLVLVGITALLIALSPTSGPLIAAGMGVSAAAMIAMTRRRANRDGEVMRSAHARKMQQAQQILHGIREYIVLGRPDVTISRFAEHNQHFADALHRQAMFTAAPRIGLEFLAVLALAMIVITGRDQTGAAIIPLVGLYAAAAIRMLPSAVRLATSAQSVSFLAPTIINVINDIGDVSRPAPLRPLAIDPMPFQDALQLDDVSYQFSGAMTATLSNVNLRIGQGTMTALVGASGAGKTTLLDLILGLLPPATGSITVDGRPIAGQIDAWQLGIGYVPQHIFLTDDSLRRNVALGSADDDIDDAAVLAALRMAQMEAEVATLPDGLDTVLGDRGVRFSGGQRQRVGIARALYRRPALLILDEATSALDPATEASVMDAVKSLRGAMTTIIATHRPAVSSQCDQIFLLADGALLKAGPDRSCRPA